MTAPLQIRRKRSEDGYMLVAVMFMLALLVIALAVAAPKVRDDIQRDREVETLHRGKQYIRAVQLYYRKFHAYPPSVDALVKTNEIRFLRKRYLDPMTGKDDWKPIAFGQAKAPIAMGFFGQPLMGSSLAGTGPSGGNGMAGASPIGGSQFGQPGGNSSFGSGSFGSQGSFGSNSGSFGSQGSFGSNSGGFGSSGSFGSSSGGSGSNPGSPGGTGSSSDGSSSSSDGSASGGPGNGFGGPTFGGAGIIGVTPASNKASILIYKTKTHYNEWEFDYDPIMDTMTLGGGGTGLGGQPASSMSSPLGGSQSPGATSGFGNPASPTQPSTPITPQQ
jgi:type II secretory pathway pseudopilin PulG